MDDDTERSALSSGGAAHQYWAFISYSSKDRTYGRWLHRRLENFVVPTDLRGRANNGGAVLQKHLRPIFRDRDELPSSDSLSNEITKALSESKCLVVLCSPNSAKSQWVNKEITDFRRMEPGRNVLAVILKGEPNSGDQTTECFPPALRDSSDPLAADLRDQGDGKTRALLKVIAGIAELNFDDLYRRHDRAFRRAAMLWGTISVLLVLTFAMLSAYAYLKQNEAQLQADQVLRLSDVKRLADLDSEAKTGWGLGRARAEEIRAWLGRVETLFDRLPFHHRRLRALQEQAKEGPNGEYSLSTTELQWEHDILLQLVDGIEQLRSSDSPIPSSVDKARRALELSQQFDAAWKEARAKGISLIPQKSLIPLGVDARSGLWELWHPQSGESPPRDDKGMLSPNHESGIVFVLIPGGTMKMGSHVEPDELPIHEVILPSFLISKYELTQGQWGRLTGTNPSVFKRNNSTAPLPVENISWLDAHEVLSNAGLRLPSESEWEFAVRAGQSSSWTSGDMESAMWEHAWYFENSRGATQPVGMKQPNAWGLHDVHGNVWEWCQDAYHESYDGAPTDGTAWDELGASYRVLRGGSWNDTARNARSANRSRDLPGNRYHDLGVRPAMSLQTQVNEDKISKSPTRNTN